MKKTLCTSTILVLKGPQDLTVYLTQSFWMNVAPPIFVANKVWAHIAKPWESSINSGLFFKIAHHVKNNDDSPFTSVRFFCFWGCTSFDTMFFGAPAIEVLLELRKYYFWRSLWRIPYDKWFTYDSFFIFRIYHGEEQTKTQIHQGNSDLRKQ